MPVQSRLRVPAAAGEALGELAARAASLQAASGGNLLGCFAAVPDRRDARGIRYSLTSVLALCTAAVLCGHTTVEDVTAWVGAAPQQVLAAAGCRRNDLGACVPPHPDTVVRIFTALGAQALASHAGAFLARRAQPGPVTCPAAGPGWLPAIAADGKAVRGAIGQDGQVPYLLAAAAHGTGTVIAEHLIGPKTNEVPELAPLLPELDEYYCLAGHVITLDALHTVRAHASFSCQELLARYVMTVKQNTPRDCTTRSMPRTGHLPPRAPGGGNRARPARTPHHPGHGRARAHQGQVPARQAGRPHRTVRDPQGPQAHQELPQAQDHRGPLRHRGVRHHQPGRPRGRASAPGRLRPRPVDHREQGPLGP